MASAIRAGFPLDSASLHACPGQEGLLAHQTLCPGLTNGLGKIYANIDVMCPFFNVDWLGLVFLYRASTGIFTTFLVNPFNCLDFLQGTADFEQ